MAKQQDKPEAGEATPAPKPRGYCIRTKYRAFNATHGPYQVRFVEGEATTDRKDVASWAAEAGYEVTDLATGKVRNQILTPEEEAEAKKAKAEEPSKK